MSFANLLGDLVGDMIRGRTTTMQYRLRNYMAEAAKSGIKAGADAAQKHAAKKAEDAKAEADKEAARVPDNEAWVLLLAMIAAAGADGDVDATEKQSIMGKAERAQLSEADTKKLEEALAKPLSAEEVAAMCTTQAQKEQAYAMALTAIEVDTVAEKQFLRKFKEALGLSDEVAKELEGDLLD